MEGVHTDPSTLFNVPAITPPIVLSQLTRLELISMPEPIVQACKSTSISSASSLFVEKHTFMHSGSKSVLEQPNNPYHIGNSSCHHLRQL